MSRTCRRCLQSYLPSDNTPASCPFHPMTFATRPHPAHHYAFEIDDEYMKTLEGWISACWECCGSEQKDAPGCKASMHVSYDDPLPSDIQ
ncbi:uncharacterized protein BJ171DRAFT_579726 [Polychytrium aggregatum]|uniref:uncharacterized protein n=1 Tax=Polychytrium aggregatum TaxID=110093 RepID=UPI0022FEBC61|nr:uncharacterized protein BJ171DRAFT_579726 [Polychytrium aggregatum]KAI9206759.1 hypothetical protein BJ171DRAFT_579726 [Polychytrium aggregatum]